MKLRCFFVIVLLTILDIFLILWVPWLLFQGILLFFINSVGVFLLFYWISKPLEVLKKKEEAMEKENRRLEEMRKDFVANVTHELKTPLTSISGFIETIQNDMENHRPMETRFIDIIAIETARLKRLIEDLFVLSDIEEKKEEVKEIISIEKEIKSMVEMMQPIADKNQISFFLELDSSLTLLGSKDRFRQMMVNLMENAIKYSNPGGNIWVNCYKKGTKIFIVVKDQGIGIPEENIPFLFGRFYRVDKSRSKKVGGTGLGLSIVKHIAMLFDAQIQVTSQLDKGTAFTIIFPCSE